jgi:hypothetical protein
VTDWTPWKRSKLEIRNSKQIQMIKKTTKSQTNSDFELRISDFDPLAR